jgi:hypothetical protein
MFNKIWRVTSAFCNFQF